MISEKDLKLSELNQNEMKSSLMNMNLTIQNLSMNIQNSTSPQPELLAEKRFVDIENIQNIVQLKSLVKLSEQKFSTIWQHNKKLIAQKAQDNIKM